MISAKLTNFKWRGLPLFFTPVYKCFDVDLGT